LRVELAAPQWPKGWHSESQRAALHLFAADDAHGAGPARAHGAKRSSRNQRLEQ
jgi:hypothetical protein